MIRNPASQPPRKYLTCRRFRGLYPHKWIDCSSDRRALVFAITSLMPKSGIAVVAYVGLSVLIGLKAFAIAPPHQPYISNRDPQLLKPYFTYTPLGMVP